MQLFQKPAFGNSLLGALVRPLCTTRGRYLLYALSSLFVLHITRQFYVQKVELDFYTLHYQSVLTQETPSANGKDICPIPTIDPWDESTRRFITSWPGIKCSHLQPYLTFLDYKGVLRFNLSEISAVGYSRHKLECRYSTFLRVHSNDDEVIHDDWRPLLNDTEINHEYVSVACDYDGALVYENIHTFIQESLVLNKIEQPTASTKQDSRSSPDSPNVFIFTIDSMSLPNFIRQLPKTYKFIVEELGAVVLRGMMKAGDNTFPNMVPMLTGRRPYPPKGVEKELPGNVSGYYDDWPFVWKNFSKAGYVTGFCEDLPFFSIFNYLAKGFQQQPTDYYMRPYWVEIDQSGLQKRSSNLCFGNVPKHFLILDWAKEFLHKFSNASKYFLFSFLTELSHDYLNQIQIVDSDVYNFLADSFKKGHFENTIVIVMGDHGNRFDGIRNTVIGMIEERMPFFSIALPKKFDRTYPHLRKNLLLNAGKMTTWFDIYELLVDIASKNFEDNKNNSVWAIRGHSPFREIPARTCEEAGVPQHYCTCQKERSLSIDGAEVKEAASQLVQYIHDILLPVRHICAELALTNVIRAEMIMPNEGVARPKGFTLSIRVVIQTSPSDALFEATLNKNAWQPGFHVVDDVSRINRYGNQSACVSDRKYERFCYCT